MSGLISLHVPPRYCQGLGMELDPARNDAAVGGASGDISSGASRVRMLVIPTDEELSIAQQTLEVVHGLQQEGGAATAA